jgi:hypothetical protein
MFLGSASSASSLGDPQDRLGLDRFRADHGLPKAKPVPIEDFVRWRRPPPTGARAANFDVRSTLAARLAWRLVPR